LARALLDWLGPVDGPVVGDIDETYQAGKSRWWYWRQALALMAISPVQQMRTTPLRAIGAVLLGWAVFLMVFGIFDHLTFASRLSAIGYQTGVWLPFWTAAFVCSYVGLGISAWTVAKAHRRQAGPILILHVASVWFAMAIAVTILELRAQPTPVPHVLFPLVSIALPYQWRSGFLLAPLTMLAVGMFASRTRPAPESR
jgi:hypothetical protein